MDGEIEIYKHVLASHLREAEKMFDLVPSVSSAADALEQCLRQGSTVLACGNGGSAADAQHLVCELVGRFKLERRGLAAVDLVSNSPTLTAIANDYGYEHVFSRQVEAFSSVAGCLAAFSTSGESESVVQAARVAKKHSIPVVAFTGKNGGRLKSLAEVLLAVPSDDTPRVQEMHLVLVHSLCEIVESRFAAHAG